MILWYDLFIAASNWPNKFSKKCKLDVVIQNPAKINYTQKLAIITFIPLPLKIAPTSTTFLSLFALQKKSSSIPGKYGSKMQHNLGWWQVI